MCSYHCNHSAGWYENSCKLVFSRTSKVPQQRQHTLRTALLDAITNDWCPFERRQAIHMWLKMKFFCSPHFKCTCVILKKHGTCMDFWVSENPRVKFNWHSSSARSTRSVALPHWYAYLGYISKYQCFKNISKYHWYWYLSKYQCCKNIRLIFSFSWYHNLLRVLRVMTVQWSLFSLGAENCAAANCMAGLLKFDLCKRGNLILLDLLWIGAIYFALFALGTLFAHFLQNWVFQCVTYKDTYEPLRCPIIIHSFAFGGRGVYLLKKKRNRSRSQTREPF